MPIMSFDNVLPGLVIATYILVEICKALFLKTDKSRKHIPLIAAIIGVACAIVIFVFWPEMIYCSNVLEAIAMGGMSGFAATGCNQLYKKYAKYKGDAVVDEVSSTDGEGY